MPRQRMVLSLKGKRLEMSRQQVAILQRIPETGLTLTKLASLAGNQWENIVSGLITKNLARWHRPTIASFRLIATNKGQAVLVALKERSSKTKKGR